MLQYQLIVWRGGKRAVCAAKFKQVEKAERYMAQYIGCCLQNDLTAHVVRHAHHKFVVRYNNGRARYIFLKKSWLCDTPQV